MALNDADAKSVLTLIEGALATFDNAQALYSEATLLANNKAWARALFLHQIASEECAKIEMLGAMITSILGGLTVDTKKLRVAFGRHEAKNKTNAYFLPTSEEEESASNIPDAIAAFKKLQSEFHSEANTLKNRALYADLGEPFSTPAEIDEATFQKTRELNDTFMAMAYGKTKLLKTWAEDLDDAQARVAQMLDRTQSLKHIKMESRADFTAAMEQVVKEMADEIRAKGEGGGQT